MTVNQFNRAAGVVTVLCILASFCSYAMASQPTSPRAIAEIKYTRAHSLGENYTFNARDGWQTINVSNSRYNRRRSESGAPRGNHTDHHPLGHKNTSYKTKIGGALKSVMENIFKGIGKSEPVIITWYTGHDLKNPSCWSNEIWAPTDSSFVAAVTQEGWEDKPKCRKFVELCKNPQNCIFVRVVDSCHGCAKGSKHVDLTKGAFCQLGQNLDVGTTTVQMRSATDPIHWYEHLWGPQ